MSFLFNNEMQAYLDKLDEHFSRVKSTNSSHKLENLHLANYPLEVDNYLTHADLFNKGLHP